MHTHGASACHSTVEAWFARRCQWALLRTCQALGPHPLCQNQPAVKEQQAGARLRPTSFSSLALAGVRCHVIRWEAEQLAGRVQRLGDFDRRLELGELDSGEESIGCIGNRCWAAGGVTSKLDSEQ